MLGGIVLALVLLVVGIVKVVREIPPLRLRIKKLQASLARIPIAQAVNDLERLEISLDGLQALGERIKRLASRK